MGKYDITDFGNFEPKPTPKQLEYVEDICAQLGCSVPVLHTLQEASDWIDEHHYELRQQAGPDEGDGPDWDSGDK